MAALNLGSLYLTNSTFENKRYFTLNYGLPNFNTASLTITDAKTNPLFRAASRLIYFTQVNVYYEGAAANVASSMLLGTTRAPISRVYYGPHTTAAATETWTWEPNVAYDVESMIDNSTIPWFQVFNLAGYGALDDINCMISGWIDSSPLDVPPTPVSVKEIHLWPKRGTV